VTAALSGTARLGDTSAAIEATPLIELYISERDLV